MQNVGIIFEEKMKKIKNRAEGKTAQFLLAVNIQVKDNERRAK